jgi:benzoate-CoA ligase
MYWYEGRADDMFKVSGLWVSPADVEARLIEHPAVVEAAVVGVAVEGLT